MPPSTILTIGQLAERTGASVSAICFYEARGLIDPIRTGGNQRRFLRSDIRRIAFILIVQQLGLSIEAIRDILAGLPHGRTPVAADWARIGRQLRGTIDDRIAMLQRTRDRLDGCIGCGCLSLKSCSLYNRDDRAAQHGSGARYLVEDYPADVSARSPSTSSPSSRPALSSSESDTK